jgi:hypothetical protein
MKKKLILLFGVITMCSCILSTWDIRLILVNTTNNKIRYDYQIKEKMDFLIDTSDCIKVQLPSLESRKEKNLLSQNKWENSLKEHPDKILRIYIFNEDTISKYGLCKVFKNEMFIKRYDLTYDDLVRLNWKVVYDGK